MEQGKPVQTAILHGGRQIVMLAMIASFILSRTLVPTLANYLLRSHDGAHERKIMEAHDAGAGRTSSRSPPVRFQHGVEQGFERIRGGAAAR